MFCNMDTVRSIGVVAGLLGCYLVPTYYRYKKAMKNTTILNTRLEPQRKNIPDILITTTNSENNNYVLRRDTVEVYDVSDDNIIDKRHRMPEKVVETEGELYMDGVKLNIDNFTTIIGFKDTNSLLREDYTKCVCTIDALRESDSYHVALNDKGYVMCIAEQDRLDSFNWNLKRKFGYFSELWFVELFLVGTFVFYMYRE